MDALKADQAIRMEMIEKGAANISTETKDRRQRGSVRKAQQPAMPAKTGADGPGSRNDGTSQWQRR